MRISRKRLNQLVAGNCPVFYLCQSDSYHPCSAEYFISHSTLRYRDIDGIDHVVLEKGAVTEEKLWEESQRRPGPPAGRDGACGGSLWLDLDPDARKGQSELCEVPVYAIVKAIHRTDCSDEFEAIEITYLTFFAHNGSYSVCGLLEVGAHDGDIEHLTVRVEPKSGNLLGVWYNAHRSRDGCWVEGAMVELNEEGRDLCPILQSMGMDTIPVKGLCTVTFFWGMIDAREVLCGALRLLCWCHLRRRPQLRVPSAI